MVNTTKILAMSDLHLNFNINTGVRRKFFNQIKKAGCPIIITGDIGDGRTLFSNLCELGKACNDYPLYFVTGNHDYYHSSFARSTEIIHQAVREYPNLVYLTETGTVALGDETCIIGADSWYDCKVLPEGQYYDLTMNDFNYIEDLNMYQNTRPEVIRRFQERASNALQQMSQQAEIAVKKFKNVILLSHPLPFGCMNTEKGSEYSHFYVWYEAGKFISDFAHDHPENQFLWLCGHTHSRSEWHNENLDVYCLGAKYYFPRIDAEIEGMKLKYKGLDI